MIMCSAPVFAQQRGDVDRVFEQYQHIVKKINLEYGTSISIGEPCVESADELLPIEEFEWIMTEYAREQQEAKKLGEVLLTGGYKLIPLEMSINVMQAADTYYGFRTYTTNAGGPFNTVFDCAIKAETWRNQTLGYYVQSANTVSVSYVRVSSSGITNAYFTLSQFSAALQSSTQINILFKGKMVGNAGLIPFEDAGYTFSASFYTN